MALPTLDKAWNFDVNIALPSLGTAALDGKRFVRAIKSKILAGGAWQVRRSSNATAAANVDLWSTDAAIVATAAGVAHSWIVFRRTDITFELLIDCCGGSGYYDRGVVVISRAGFTGGTTTNRPTATDEFYSIGTALSAALWHNAGTAAFSSVLHCMYSADGEVQRIVALKAAATVMFIDLTMVKNPPSGWVTPFVVGWVNKTPTFELINDNPDDGTYVGMHGSLGFRAYLVTESYSAAAKPLGEKLTVQNEISGEWTMAPAAVVGYTPGVKGRHGEVYDLWFGPRAVSNCTTYPADHSRLFIQFNDVILPWANPPGPGPTVLTS